MWINIVLSLVLLLAVTYLIQWLVPSTRGRKGSSRQYLKWDIAPIIGFFGILLLALSFVEAARRAALLAWGLGSALGLIATTGVWIALTYWWSLPPRPAQRRVSLLRMVFRIVRTYGLVFLIVLLGLNLSIRYFGSAIEVFVSGTLGVLVIGMATAVFTRVPSRQ
jgi:hypothetical protein